VGRGAFSSYRITDWTAHHYPWERFRQAFGFAANWRLAGNTYRLTPERIAQSQFEIETDIIDAVIGSHVISGEDADETFGYLLDQVELFQQSVEGRKYLREHLIRERDPALIRAFKRGLSSFCCSVCNFDFKKVYGPIGEGFIEAHHVEHIGTRDDDQLTTLRDLVPVCSNCHRMLHRRVPLYRVDELAS
jgi:predicted HNH restriction endonuclease